MIADYLFQAMFHHPPTFAARRAQRLRSHINVSFIHWLDGIIHSIVSCPDDSLYKRLRVVDAHLINGYAAQALHAQG